MLKIWGRRNSFNVQKVMWLVGELGLAHEHIDAGGAFGGLDTPAFRAMNPHGRVPVIDVSRSRSVRIARATLRRRSARSRLMAVFSASALLAPASIPNSPAGLPACFGCKIAEKA